MKQKKRTNTCYRYPDTRDRKTKAVKARPTKRSCRRPVKSTSAAKTTYNAWDKRTKRPARAKNVNKPVHATKPGSRKGKY